ncbi:MAG TPA: hypothetical protein EYH35_01730, partial [Thiotrichaceae bacterium]|nr:hypothetical protein [Thiotrichaceae bacterium]
MKRLLQLTVILISAYGLSPASANQKLSGSLLAKKACPVLHSIRKQSNPSKSFLDIDTQYPVIGKNKVAASHYLITGSFGQRKQGWVETSCGVFSEGNNPVKSTTKPRSSKAAYLLALSWQPSFCARHKSKKECRQLTSESASAKQLSLHGLWPQPRNNTYCNVSNTDKSIDRQKQWQSLPKLPLEPITREALADIMPGYQSNLHRHEWVKHGSCYPDNADQYYADSIALTIAINQSALGDLLKNNLGKKISSHKIRQAID